MSNNSSQIKEKAERKFEEAKVRARSQKIGFHLADIQERDLLRKTRFKLRKKGRL